VLEVLLTLIGITAPALLVAAIVRRWFAELSWKTAAGYLALTLLFLHGAAVTSQLPVPVDEVNRGYPYVGVVGEVTAKNALTNDTVRQFLPWMQIVRDDFAHGRLPLWNRYSFSGYPLLGNGQSAPFSPFFLITLFVPLPKQIVAMAGLKIFIALLFMHLLARREGASNGAAAFAAIAFAISTYQTVYLYYPHTAVSALLPAAVFAILQALRSPERRWLLLTTAVIAAMLAGGHPESVFHAAVATVAMMAIDLAAPTPSTDRRRLLRGLPRILFAVTLGLLISAPAWLPVAEQVRLSTRYAEIRAAGRMMTPSLPGVAAWALVNPDLFGNPARGTWQWFLNYAVVAPSYFGILPLALIPASVFGRGSGTRDRLLILFAAGAFLISMNWTPFAEFANTRPPFSLVANDRLRYAVCFALALASARALERLAERKGVWFALAGSIAVVAVAAEGVSRKLGTTVGYYAIAGCVTAVLFWIAVGALARSGRLRLIPFAGAATLAIELFVFLGGYNALTERRFYRTPLPIVAAVHRAAPKEPFRVVGFDWVMMPNASGQYGVEDIRGSDPMSPASYTDFFRRIEADDPAVDIKRIQNIDQPGIDFLNVRFVLAEPGFEHSPSWRAIYNGPDGVLLENQEWVRRFFAPVRILPGEVRDGDLRIVAFVQGIPEPAVQAPVKIRLRQPAPTRFDLSVEATERTFIASSQTLLPGWSVVVNGQKTRTYRVNGAFLGFFVEAGRSEVTVDYFPRAFVLGLVLSVAGLIAVVFAWFRRARSEPVIR
jgi:hypothetical protein